MLNNWTILQNVFCILFRKYSRHIHLRHVYVVNANTLSIVSICKRKKKLNYWTILQNVFSLFLAKGQDIFTFVISGNFAHGDFRNSTAGQFFKIFSDSFQQKSKTRSSSSCSYSSKCFWIPFSKRPRHIYRHQVHVILPMLTAETVTLNKWTILQNVFWILFRKYSRHIHLRCVYVVLIMVMPRTPLIDDQIIFQNVFGFFRHKDFRDDDLCQTFQSAKGRIN